MARRLYNETNASAGNAIAEDGRWLMGIPAIVADNQDPERQHRIRVIIPSIDEDLIFDEWANQLIASCLGDGFGAAFIPPKGSEVVLFGQLGQKFNLFYSSRYNEDFLMPEGFPDEMTVGIHAPGNLKFIAEQLAKIEAQNVEIVAAQIAKFIGNNVTVQAQATNSIIGNPVQIQGNQITANAPNITVSGDNSIAIQGGNVTIDGDSVLIQGQPVSAGGEVIDGGNF